MIFKATVLSNSEVMIELPGEPGLWFGGLPFLGGGEAEAVLLPIF